MTQAVSNRVVGAVQISVTGMDDVRALLSGINSQMPFAIALSLTRTAQAVKQELVDEMKRVFDRPTPYALGGLFIEPATKTSLTSRVGIKDADAVFKTPTSGMGTPAINFLMPQVYGGKRREKRFEKALRYKNILPLGCQAVPARGAPLDQYGNVPAKFIIQILSYLQAFSEVGYTANITKAGKIKKMKKGLAYFAVKSAGAHGLHPGIYKRTSNRWGAPLEAIFLFVKAPKYKTRYQFHEVGQKKADQVWRGIFDNAVNDAIRTAK